MSTELKSKAARLGLSEQGMAAYLGVPVHTYRKWANGARAMDSAPLRVLQLLEAIETQAPGLHAQLIERAKASERPAKPPKSPGKGKAPANPETRPSEPPAPFVHVVQALPDWMTQAL